jgi:Mg-chelatase subunit ChlD
MFALLAFPLIAAAGISLDLYRLNDARAALAQASDAAVLAAARAKLTNPLLTDVQAAAVARKMFDANTRSLTRLAVSDFTFEKDVSTDVFRITAKAALDTTLMRLAGKTTLDLDIISEARAGKPRDLEVVLVLDNTGSMDGAKMTDLKDAAGDLVDKIMADSGNTTKVGLVPFARHVNVGVANASAPWLDIPPDGTWDENVCTVDIPAATAAGCSEGPSTCYWDGEPYSCTAWTCPSGDAPTNCSITTHPTTWFGCVGSRAHPNNIEDDDYGADRVPGVLNAGGPDCPQEVTKMTLNKTTVENAIDAMTVGGDTYIPGGLFWGQALISNVAPYTEGRPYDEVLANGGVKAIVLMTDGENTASPAWDAHYGSDKAQADDYTREICDEIKAANIQLYTIAFDITDSGTIDLMRNCATDASNFYEAHDADLLSGAFEIGQRRVRARI